MFFVLVAFFQALGLTLITEPLNRFLIQIFDYLPRLIGPAILLLIAWVVASSLRFLVRRLLSAARVDERLGEQVGADEESAVSLSDSLAEAVYWLVLLLFLPAVLGGLGLDGLLQPVQNLVDSLVGFLPNLIAAAVILGVGWLVAKIVQRILSSLLAAIGIDRFSERVGLAGALGRPLSEIVGLIVYVLILIPVLISALDTLQLVSITQPASQMLRTILDAIPALFGALLVLGIAYLISRVVAGLITNLLTGIGFNSLLGRLGLASESDESRRTPAEIVGYLIQVMILLFAAIEAANMLGFSFLAELYAQFLVFGSKIVLGLIILAVGLFLANLAATALRSSGSASSSLLATLARISILVLAAAIALREMGLANEIINLAFGLLLGAVAVAAAIAFGLGGRDAAARQLEEWKGSGQAEPPRD